MRGDGTLRPCDHCGERRAVQILGTAYCSRECESAALEAVGKRIGDQIASRMREREDAIFRYLGADRRQEER